MLYWLKDITVEAQRFIEADLIFYPSGACGFVLSWNHILLDAKGTTLLFAHLNNLSENIPEDLNYLFPAKEKKPNIYRYIRNMYRIHPANRLAQLLPTLQNMLMA